MTDTGIFSNIPIHGYQVIHGKAMYGSITCNSGKSFEFLQRNIQKIGHPLGSCVHFQTGTKLGILGGNTHRAVSAAADPILLACSGDQACAGDSYGIRTHGQSLGKVCGHSQTTGDHQRNIRMHGIQVLSGSAQCIDRRHGSCLSEHQRTGACCTATSIDGNKVRIGKNTVFQISLNISRSDLDTDRTSFGTAAKHIHHVPQVLFGIDLREFAGALHVLSRLFAAKSRDLRCYLFSRQMTAHTGLSSLTDLDLNSV